jgi:hypothetical protein
VLEESAHIHLGPGCLGLGLIVSSSCRAGLEVHVVSLRGGTQLTSNDFELEVVDSLVTPPRLESHRVDGFWEASTVEQLAPPLREVLLHRPHLLITTSLTTSGLEAAQPFIQSLVEERQRAGFARSTTFIGAENDLGPTWEQFRLVLEASGTRPLRAMVNRYCPSRSDANGLRRVVVDVEEEWVIELSRLPIPPPVAVLADLPHVEVVASTTAFEKRKLWLINGTHLALAIVARSTRNIQKMNIAGREPERQRWVSMFQHDMSRVLRDTGMALGDEAQYGSRHFESVLRHEDSVGRILRRFTRSDLTAFLDDFQLKVGEAMRFQMAKRGHLSPAFQELLDELQKLLLWFDAFEDAAAIRTGEIWLSASTDEESIARYMTLISQTMDPELVPERIRVLRRVWARHRERFDRRTGEERRKSDRRQAAAPNHSPDRRAERDRRSGMDRRLSHR